MRIALYEPEIAGNVGAVLRLGACLGVPVDLIEPMGFAWDDARVRRTAMDYIDHVAVARHKGFAAFRETIAEARLVLFTTKAECSLYEAKFEPADVLLFGKESAGVPANVAAACDLKLKIPTARGVRSFNVAMAAGIAVSEALRQSRLAPISA
jgi:tRNA (cytidine/uridine-2'-O-)-methyltransferase